MNHSRPPQRTRHRPKGLVLLETLIAAGVTLVMLSVAVPMVIRSARIWKQTQHQQFAADELQGQMDRLIAMPSQQRARALENLTLSPEIQNVLYDARIEAATIDDQDGKRIELSIDWTRVGAPPPVRLVAWINPFPEATSPAPDSTDTPDPAAGDQEDEQ
ncbi:type IV pilus modification PilV family protein [Rhodopirellula sp. JC639]|uniref:type IV pilus modification PilV family protein n=1 Tax=Stieleria mannarensis TaxID=2755585 RepID=UPI001601F1F1|nr:hypothetical protein [Rhodopirellula sp. JC639]